MSAVPGDQALALSWQYATTGGRPKLLHLDFFQMVNGAPVKVASNIVGQTVEPDTYTIPAGPGAYMVRATPENDAGFGTGINSAVVNIVNACGVADICAHITTASAPSKISLVAQGMHNGGVV
ncbi:MAG: hypothetical protein JOZ99_11420, partial [Actinobacteria bacterium]|nr:hypothetical protein [Actinomycetota bacterium]